MRRWREWDRSGRNIRNPPVSAPILVHRRSLHSSFPALRFFHSSFRSLRDEDGRSGVTDDGRRMSPWVTEERQAARSLRSSRYCRSLSSPTPFTTPGGLRSGVNDGWRRETDETTEPGMSEWTEMEEEIIGNRWKELDYDVMRECRGTWEQEIDSFWLVFPWLGS